MIPEHILVDLSRKCGDDVADRIRMTTMLVDRPSEAMMIAMSAAGAAIGWAAGFSQKAIAGQGEQPTPDQHIDMMWNLLRPIALKAMGGSDADFRALLAKVGGARKRDGAPA